MTALYLIAIAVYAALSTALFVFGANLARCCAVAWRHRHRPAPRATSRHEPGTEQPAEHQGPDNPGRAGTELPAVTVQLPIYNERYVARRAIDAACRLDYPRDRLQIQVLDDSDDETADLVALAVDEWRRRGVDIEHLHRSARGGYKAGALAAGLAKARGSLIAIFDADFVPPSDFLSRTVPHFAEPSIAFVQGRWGHLNSDQSWLTRLQVPAIDGHFLVEQRARGLRGHWFNFNGTAGVWRAAAIADAGGWQHDTLTEDLDLSYRAHLRGWRGRYLDDLVVPGELPAELSGFRRQQHRWARGSLECAAKLLAPIWRSDAGIGVKVQATLHLGAYGVHLLLAAVVLAYPLVLLASEALGSGAVLYWLGFVLAPASLTPALFLVTGQALQPTRGWRRLPAVVGMVIFGSGLMINTVRALLAIRFRPDPEFERTPKYGLRSGDGATNHRPRPRGRRARAAPSAGQRGPALDRIVIAEAALAAYGLATAVLAFSLGSWGVFAYSVLFASGLVAVAGASVIEAVAANTRRAVAAVHEGAVATEPAAPEIAGPVAPVRVGDR